MKTILCMAITLNGIIAKLNGDSEFASPEDNAFFRSMCKRTGNAIIGKNTYAYIQSKGYQQNDILTVVVTHDPQLLAKQTPHTICTDKHPREIIVLLKEKGFKEALVCGGGIVNSLFLKERLIDEIYLDIEPVVLGRGIPLFADSNFESRLQLLGIKKLTNNQTIQLHYKVLK